MQQYQVKITGINPLLMHMDDIDWADKMESWKNDPANNIKGATKSKAGDDRTPAWRWVGYAYSDGEHFALPTDNFMACLGAAGSMVPTGKGKKTLKAQSQSGMFMPDAFWPLLVDGALIPWAPFEQLVRGNEQSFMATKELAKQYGFDLLVKRATVGMSKHIRVRPIFRNWSCEGTVSVVDDEITQQALETLFTYGGSLKGIGDWRPGSKKPGRFGTFTAEVKRI